MNRLHAIAAVALVVISCVTARSQDAVRDSLSQSARLDFVETPAEVMLDVACQMHGLKCEIDGEAAVQTNLQRPTSHNLSRISAASALSLILRDVGLTYIVTEDGIRVVTPERKNASVAADGALPFRRRPLTDYDTRIIEALKRKTPCEFRKTSLSKALEELESQCEVEFEFDWRIIAGGMYRPGKLIVTYANDREPLSIVLEELLKNLGLTFVVRDELILITSPNKRLEPGDLALGKGEVAFMTAESDGEVVAQVPPNLAIEVLEIRPAAIKCAANVDGKRVVGWVDRDAVEPSIPADVKMRD